MLDLIAITYENIWPFKDQKLSLFFKEGNFLVKAPIGTGKSFCFLMVQVLLSTNLPEEIFSISSQKQEP